MATFVEFDYLYNESGIFILDEIISVGPSQNSLAPQGTNIVTTVGNATVKNSLQEVTNKLDSLGWKGSVRDKKIFLTALNGQKIELPATGVVMIIGCRPKHNYTNVFYFNKGYYSVLETPSEVMSILGYN